MISDGKYFLVQILGSIITEWYNEAIFTMMKLGTEKRLDYVCYVVFNESNVKYPLELFFFKMIIKIVFLKKDESFTSQVIHLSFKVSPIFLEGSRVKYISVWYKIIYACVSWSPERKARITYDLSNSLNRVKVGSNNLGYRTH